MTRPASDTGSVKRREFLSWSLGAASVLTPAILQARGGQGLGKVAIGNDPGKAPVRSNSPRVPAHVSVGYLPGSEGLDGLETLTHSVGEYVDTLGASVDPSHPDGPVEVLRDRLVDPHKLYSGERGFLETGVRCTVHGLFVGDGALWEQIGPSAVYAHYAPFTHTPHLAWADDGLSAGRPVTFDVPATKEDGLVLSIDLHGDRWTSAPDGKSSSKSVPFDGEDFWDGQVFARFVTNNERGALKLRRGIYTIAWTPLGARRYPAPEGCTIAVAQSKDSDSTWLSCLEGRAAEEFAYLLVSIEPTPMQIDGEFNDE